MWKYSILWYISGAPAARILPLIFLHSVVRLWQSLREGAKRPNTQSVSCLSVGNGINNPTWFNFLIYPPFLFMSQQGFLTNTDGSLLLFGLHPEDLEVA